MALGLPYPVTKMILNLLQPYRPVQACSGFALLLLIFFKFSQQYARVPQRASIGRKISYALLNSVLHKGEWSVTRSGRFTPKILLPYLLYRRLVTKLWKYV
jgi:hypothetical protein